MKSIRKAVLFAAVLLLASAAQASVDANGGWTQSMDIELPPAIGDEQPHVALSYNSHDGNGLVGMGWSLEGIPSIARMNYGSGINFASSDTFVGPQGRLINFNGSNVYHTEQETWARYVPYNSDGSVWTGVGGCGNGPCYWRVTHADGNVWEFGTSSDSRIEAVGRGGAVREWALARAADTSGNFYTVKYQEVPQDGDYFPTTITYNQGNARSKLYSVDFAYEPRVDTAVDFSSGAAVRATQRLKWITVSSGGQLIRKYRLDYEYGTATGVSRLTTVREYGRDGTSTLPAQTFRWQEGSSSWTSIARRSDWGPNNGFTTESKYPLFIGDWNGDGRADIGRVHNTGTTFQISTGSGWAPYADDWNGGPNRGFTDANRYPILIGDWNGDSKMDFGRVWNGGIYFRVSTGAGWQDYPDGPAWGPNNGYTDASKYPVLIGDWNGDGMTDIGRVHNAGIAFYVSTGSGWAPYADDWDGGPNRGFTDASRYPILIGDWNGDGRMDFGRVNNAGIYFRISTGTGWQGYPDGPTWGPNNGFVDGNVYPVLIGDWNGDGMTDIGRVGNTGTGFYLSTGAGWRVYADGPAWSLNNGFSDGNRFPILIGDWNGDGMTDIGRVGNTGTGFQLSTGEGWRTFTDWPHWGQNEGYTEAAIYPTLSGDWTGEGKYGLARVDNAGIGFITRAGATPDLLVSTTSSLGATTSITYMPATLLANAVRPDINTCGEASGAACGSANPSPTPLVTRVAVTDGRGNTYSSRYEYFNPRYLPGLPQDAVNLGFEQVHEIDEQLSRRETTRYYQYQPFQGMTAKAETFASTGQLIQRTVNRVASVTSPNATRLLRIVSTQQEQYEFGALKNTSEVRYAHDSYGNVILESDLGDVGTAADDLYESTAYINDGGQWRIGLPYDTKTCADSACSSVLQRVTTYYDGLPSGTVGQRALVTHSLQWRSDDGTWPSTGYTYDAAGNIVSRTNSAGIVVERNTYDPSSGALTMTADALGNSVTTAYDAVTGQLIATSDPNGNTSRFFYDGFGRRIRTETPSDTQPSVVEEALDLQQRISTQTVWTDNSSIVTAKYLDGLGRVWKTTQTWDGGALLQTDAYFDAAGRDYKSCAPHRAGQSPDGSSCTTRIFDAAGRLERTESPRSGGGFASTSTAYDGYRTTVTDPDGRATNTDYDPSTLTSTLTQPSGLATRTQKDVLGRVIAVTDPAGNVATYRYNSLGWKLSQTDPVTGVTTFAYDALGNVVERRDAAGQATRVYYDTVGRVVRTDFAPLDATHAGSEDTVHKYDFLTSPGDIANGRGRLVSTQDRSGTASFAYDAAGRPRTVTRTVEGVQYAFTTAYNRAGQRTAITYPDGSVVGYHYETDAGHLSGITLDGVELMRYGDYSERGSPTSLMYGDHIEQVSLRFEDSTGELLQQQDSLGFINNLYSYDTRGMLVQERDLRAAKPNGDTSKAFAYDPLGQLVGAAMGVDAACSSTQCVGSAWSKRYVYDNVGRVLEKDGKAFTYDSAKPFRLVRLAGEQADRAYDPVGRLTAKAAGTSTDSYVNGSDGFMAEHLRDGTLLHRMTYDHQGNRVKKEYLGVNPQTTWDLGNYKIVLDRSSGKYFHTLYVMGLHQSRIAHRTVQKPGMAASATGSSYQDRALASLYNPLSIGGFGPWMQYSSKAVLLAFISDLQGARGTRASLVALTMLLSIGATLLWSLWNLMSAARIRLRSVKVPARPWRTRWLVPASLCVLCAACIGSYEASAPTDQGSAESIAKDHRYNIMQALTPGGSNQPVPGSFYYLNSPLGSTSVMFDTRGAALLRLEYFPDGTVDPVASQGDYIATHTFGQKEYDKELEAYYNAFRYYDAETMRFTTPDAIKDSSDFLVHNTYAYTRNNPGNYTDATGFIWAMKADGQNGYRKVLSQPTPPTYRPATRPSNPVRTSRFNTGPDGVMRAPVARQLARPSPAMKVDGAAGTPGAGGKKPQKVPKNYKPPVYPPQPLPPGAVPSKDPKYYDLPNGHRVRIGEPWVKAPDGYWKEEAPDGKGGWQPVDPTTGKPPGSMSAGDAGARVHIPLPHGPCIGCCNCPPIVSVDPQDIAPIIVVGVGGVGAGFLIGAGGGMRLRF